MSNYEEIKASVYKFFSSHPLVGIISFAASLLTIGFMAYNFTAGRDARELAFRLNPVKTSIVRSGQYGPLSVFVGQEKIETDVTAMQVAIWNKGEIPILADDIIEEIEILLEPTSKLLDAEITKTSRSLIGFKITDRQFDRGRIRVSWKIFEHNDGGVIQLILSGGAETDIKVTGAIIGQRQILRVINPKEEVVQKRTTIDSIRDFLIMFAIFSPTMAVIGLILLLFRKRKKSREAGKQFKLTGSDIKFFIRYFAYGVLCFILYLLIGTTPRPPFGF